MASVVDVTGPTLFRRTEVFEWIVSIRSVLNAVRALSLYFLTSSADRLAAGNP